jgi:hypothetical protein
MLLAAAVRAAAPPQYHLLVQRQPPGITKPITLVEAWEIALAYGRQWHNDVAIARLQSTDINDSASGQAGSDGRRRTWQAVLVSSAWSNPQLWIRITDGVVSDSIEQPASQKLVAIAKKPTLDSPSAIATAMAAEPGFAPGHGKGQGFHFSLATKGGTATIGVHGSLRDQPAIIEVDAMNGQVIELRYLTYGPSGGVLYSTDAGVTWIASDLTRQMVTSIAADPIQKGCAYATLVSEESIAVYQTVDNGAHWSLIGQLPQAAGSWPFDILASVDAANRTMLLVGTASGLWVSEDDGRTWIRNAGLPSGPAQWLGVAQAETGTRIFVSLTAGANAGLYATTNLSRWEKVVEGVYRLSHSYDKRAVLAIDERKPGQGLVFGYESSSLIDLPLRTLRAAGALDSSAPFVAESPDGISIKENGEWRDVLRADLASLVAASDFPSSGVAVAGGFRSGIYRSNDGG